MINFLNDPLGEMPWEEEEGTEDVRHIHTRGVGKLCKVLLIKMFVMSFQVNENYILIKIS